jgi:hypothetical protein
METRCMPPSFVSEYPQGLLLQLIGLRAVWLRPSKQIRAPLYSMKVKKQRRWMVVKYGFVYTCVVSAFGALIILRMSSSFIV